MILFKKGSEQLPERKKSYDWFSGAYFYDQALSGPAFQTPHWDIRIKGTKRYTVYPRLEGNPPAYGTWTNNPNNYTHPPPVPLYPYWKNVIS